MFTSIENLIRLNYQSCLGLQVQHIPKSLKVGIQKSIVLHVKGFFFHISIDAAFKINYSGFFFHLKRVVHNTYKLKEINLTSMKNLHTTYSEGKILEIMKTMRHKNNRMLISFNKDIYVVQSLIVSLLNQSSQNLVFIA